MAQKVTTHLVDDLTGDTIEHDKGRTVNFDFDGSNYEIDLTTTTPTHSAKRSPTTLPPLVR